MVSSNIYKWGRGECCCLLVEEGLAPSREEVKEDVFLLEDKTRAHGERKRTLSYYTIHTFRAHQR